MISFRTKERKDTMGTYSYADVYDYIRYKIDCEPDSIIDELAMSFFEKYSTTDDKLKETIDAFLDSVYNG